MQHAALYFVKMYLQCTCIFLYFGAAPFEAIMTLDGYKFHELRQSRCCPPSSSPFRLIRAEKTIRAQLQVPCIQP